MKFKYLFFVSALFISAVSCKQKSTDKIKNDTGINVNLEKLNTPQSAIKVADSIMYITNVKNPDSASAYYMDQWLSGVKIQDLADKIFQAVYDKRLKAYNYITGKEMSIKEVKELESEFRRKDIGQILFTEDWYFDEKELKMYKQVNSIMLAYFRYDDDGNLLGNKAGIRVYLNGTKPMRGAQDY
ncbi:MAG: hypothetical protein GXO80_09765 [Chlorobi bacterium]|nr:hypothetical protein [Chlorobiota bacterium]